MIDDSIVAGIVHRLSPIVELYFVLAPSRVVTSVVRLMRQPLTPVSVIERMIIRWAVRKIAIAGSAETVVPAMSCP